MLGIIGGTGFYNLGKAKEKKMVSTPYGKAYVEIIDFFGKEVLFVPRHGKNHELPPHQVNYRANIYAFKQYEVGSVFATYACGIINKYKPGDLVLLKDYIGCFVHPPPTFFDSFVGGIRHADVSEPFDRGMEGALKVIGKQTGIALKGGGVVATMPGPRFESRAEIMMLGKMGANLVSMTNAYETSLLAEIEMPLAGIAIGTNYAAGISKKRVTHEEVMGMMAKSKGKIGGLIQRFVEESE
ncbi:MAG: MTAP family purine nucleoside phosphorylase [Candidatus Bilamarchaeaceae archaeon]